MKKEENVIKKEEFELDQTKIIGRTILMNGNKEILQYKDIIEECIIKIENKRYEIESARQVDLSDRAGRYGLGYEYLINVI